MLSKLLQKIENSPYNTSAAAIYACCFLFWAIFTYAMILIGLKNYSLLAYMLLYREVNFKSWEERVAFIFAPVTLLISFFAVSIHVVIESHRYKKTKERW